MKPLDYITLILLAIIVLLFGVVMGFALSENVSAGVVNGGYSSSAKNDATPVVDTYDLERKIKVLEEGKVMCQNILTEYRDPCTFYDGVIDDYAETEEEATWAKKVMRCESHCNVDAYNSSSGASGIMQIIPKWHPDVNVWDGEDSIRYALYKYRLGGKNLWECK